LKIQGYILLLVTTIFVASSSYSTNTLVSSAAQISTAMSSIHPGDTVTMANGTWTNQHIIFQCNGTALLPIVLHSQGGYGSVILNGTSTLRIAGNYLVVDGLRFEGGYSASGDVIEFRNSSSGIESAYSRLTNSAVIDYNPSNDSTDYKWVSLYGNHNRVDHCYMAGKTHAGTTCVVWRPTTAANYHQIDHNYFGPRPVLGYNGAETIRIGTSDQSLSSSFTVVEYNYFYQCNGEIETVSNKSCDNIYRYNTFVECQGTLTLRHGNRCRVEGNFFLANHAANSGGIRIIGEDHVVVNNYIASTDGNSMKSTLTIMDGVLNSPLDGYFQVKRAVVAFNTLVDNREPFNLGSKGSGATLPPLDCTIADNIVYSTTSPLITQSDSTINTTWQGNIFYGATLGISPAPAGIINTDPKFAATGSDGLRHILASSPAINAAVGSYPTVVLDMDGQTRDYLKDIGADEYSTATVTIRPLTSSDVGPTAVPFTITVVHGLHGTIVPGTTSVIPGGSQKFTITPSGGYYVDSVIVDGVYIPDSTSSYTFKNVLAPHTITASFTTSQFTLTTTAANGSVTRNPDRPAYDSLTTVLLTAVPGIGYHFTGWSGDTSGTTNPVTILMDRNKSITAQFAINGNTVTSSGAHGPAMPWSAGSTWSGGSVPSATDNVTILSGDTVVYDMTADTVTSLTINGAFRTSASVTTSLRIQGDLTLNATGTLRAQQNTITGNLIHTITLLGNLTDNGTEFDCRNGSVNSTLSVINFVLTGSSISTISMNTPYSSTNGDFNGMTINKEGSGKVVLGTSIFLNTGSTSAPAATSLLTFQRGVVETGSNALIHLTTTNANIGGFSDSSYVLGTLGRGMASGATTKDFPVGDAGGLRLIRIHTPTGYGSSTTGYYILVHVIDGNANTGSSSFTGGIDRVSSIRYYGISYNKGTTPLTSFNLDRFSPSYGADDGIRGANTQLRAAWSTDNRATWHAFVQGSSFTTRWDSLPRTFIPDTLASPIALVSGGSEMFVALADSTGGGNPLDGTVPVAAVTPDTLSFGDVAVGTSKTDSLFCSNTGSGTLQILAVSILGDSSFTVPAIFPLVVPPAGIRTLPVQFAPSATGQKSAEFIIFHDAPGSPDTVTAGGTCSVTYTITASAGSHGAITPAGTIQAAPGDSVIFFFQPENGYAVDSVVVNGNDYPDSTLHFTYRNISASGTIHVAFRPTAVTFSAVYTQGWNIVSIPVASAGESVRDFLPSISGKAFSYDGAYRQTDTLRHGSGYWVKIPSTDTGRVSGPILSRDTVALNVRWNLIGSISAALPVDSLVTIPPGLVTSRVFRYDGSAYRIADTLRPGNGYWIKSSSAGKLLMNPAPGSPAVSFAKKLIQDSHPPMPPVSGLSFAVPHEVVLSANWPNPFNPSTHFSYSVPVGERVTITIYDLLGRVVATLVDRTVEPGVYDVEWDATAGGQTAGGVYFCRLTAGASVQVRQILLVK
jgi:poly(beta-D-mannuronate) lyase